jgi:hypothetical protein
MTIKFIFHYCVSQIMSGVRTMGLSKTSVYDRMRYHASPLGPVDHLKMLENT